MNQKQLLRVKRHRKIRSKLIGTTTRPRLSIFRGNRSIFAQLIDDTQNKTIFGISDKGLSSNNNGIARSEMIANEIAKRAKDMKISEIVFDRGGFRYHGQIKVIADTLRAQGLKL